jgi:cytochrome b561
MSENAVTLPPRYDRITIAFHWLTALLVTALVGTSFAWKYTPRDWGLKSLESLHISLGIILAAVLVGRLLWRAIAGRKLAAAGSTATALLSRLVHWALYGLLALQVALGFGLRWLQGDVFRFFQLFSIPSPFSPDRTLAHQFQELHELAAWALIIVAGGHAVAALVHRYWLKDDVLQRMLPARG